MTGGWQWALELISLPSLLPAPFPVEAVTSKMPLTSSSLYTAVITHCAEAEIILCSYAPFSWHPQEHPGEYEPRGWSGWVSGPGHRRQEHRSVTLRARAQIPLDIQGAWPGEKGKVVQKPLQCIRQGVLILLQKVRLLYLGFKLLLGCWRCGCDLKKFTLLHGNLNITSPKKITVIWRGHWPGKWSHFYQTHMNMQWQAVKGIQNKPDCFALFETPNYLKSTKISHHLVPSNHWRRSDFSLPKLWNTFAGTFPCPLSPQRAPGTIRVHWDVICTMDIFRSPF